MTIVWWNWGHPTPSTKMTTILVCWNSNRHSFIHSFKWLVVIIHTHSGYGCLFLCLCLSLIAFYLFLFVQIKYKIRVARQMVYKYNGITQTINIKRLHSTHRRGFFLFFLIFICWCVECAKALYWNRYLRLSDDSPHHHHHSRHKKKTQHTTHKRLKKNEKLGWIRKYTLSYFNGPWQLLPAERGKVGRKRPSLFLFFSLVQNKLKSIKPSKENPYGQQQQPIFCLILYVEFHDGVVKMSQTVINAFSVWQQVKRVIVELGKKKR